jgi:hypothetical protein
MQYTYFHGEGGGVNKDRGATVHKAGSKIQT